MCAQGKPPLCIKSGTQKLSNIKIPSRLGEAKEFHGSGKVPCRFRREVATESMMHEKPIKNEQL